jgi:hypothetical protein
MDMNPELGWTASSYISKSKINKKKKKKITQITFKIRKHKRQNTQITFKIRRLCLMHELVRSPFEHKSDFVLIGRKKGLLGLQKRGTCN